MTRYTLDEQDVSGYGSLKLPEFRDVVKFVQSLSGGTCVDIVKELSEGSFKLSEVYNADLTMKEASFFRSSFFCDPSLETRARVRSSLSHAVKFHTESEPGVPRSLVLSERISYLRYDHTNSGHFLKHTDSAYIDASGNFVYTSPHRKVTTVTALNSDFEGGDFILHSVRDEQGNPIRVKLPVGSTVIFPSDIRFPHEVTPVTRGTRYTVVGWYDYAA